MARTLGPTLTAAVSSQLQLPILSLTLQDLQTRFSVLQQNATTFAARNSWVLSSSNTLLRAVCTQVADPNTVYIQRVVSPYGATQWAAAYSAVTANARASAGCTLAVSGSTLWLFYQRTSDQAICYRTSTNDGVTWSAEAALPASPLGIGNFCYGIWADTSSSVYASFATTDPYGNCGIYHSTWNGTAWSAWSAATGPTSPQVGKIRGASAFNNGAGTSCFAAGCQMRASLTGFAPAFFTLNAGTWSPFTQLLPMDNPNLGLSFMYPAAAFQGGSYYLTAQLHDDGSVSGTPGWRVVIFKSPDFATWQMIAHLSGQFSYEVQVAQLAGTLYYFDGQTVITATPTPASSDISNDVLAVDIREQEDAPSEMTVTLDNGSGHYNSNPNLRADAQLQLSLGYGTSSILTHTMTIDSWDFVSSAQADVVIVHARDHAKLLDYVNSRVWVYSGQTVGTIAQNLCRQAGVTLASLPATSQFSQTVPCFIFQPGETWLSALLRLGSLYDFDLFADQVPQLHLFEKSAADPSQWTYGEEAIALSYAQSGSQANTIRVIGQGSSLAAPVFADTLDPQNLMTVGRERYRHVVERLCDTSAKCALKASLILSGEQRDATAAQLEVALNPQHQIEDVISFTSTEFGLGPTKLRLRSIDWQIDMNSFTFTQRLTCTGV